jgi:hypothetical protein
MWRRVDRRFGGTNRLHLQGGRKNKKIHKLAPALTISSLADLFIFPSVLKMEAIRSSETSVNTTSTLCHIPEDCFLHSNRLENLKSYTEPELYETTIEMYRLFPHFKTKIPL